MWNSNLHYNLLQQGAGKYEESEESEVFSQGTESFQEETENWEPWPHIFDEAEKRHETQLNALINEYEGDGDSENVARVKAENALFPVYRKRAKKSTLGESTKKKDPTFKKVMETQKELKDSEGFDWLESSELAIDKRKFLFNRLYERQPIPQDQDYFYYEFFPWTFVLLRFNKNCKQTNFNCVLMMTSQSLQPCASQIAVYLTLFAIGF